MNRRDAFKTLTFVALGTREVFHFKTASAIDYRRQMYRPAPHVPPKLGEGLRISTQPGDIGCVELAKLQAADKRIRVFLDDVEQLHCTTADEDRGYVVRLMFDDEGRPLIGGDQLLEETRYGAVRIEISDPPETGG